MDTLSGSRALYTALLPVTYWLGGSTPGTLEFKRTRLVLNGCTSLISPFIPFAAKPTQFSLHCFVGGRSFFLFFFLIFLFLSIPCSGMLSCLLTLLFGPFHIIAPLF